MLKGELTVWVGSDRFALRRGDAICYPATTAHRWEKSRGVAEVLWVVTPPSW